MRLSRLKIFALPQFSQETETFRVECIQLLRLISLRLRLLLLPLQLQALSILISKKIQLPRTRMERMSFCMNFGLQRKRLRSYNWTQLNLKYSSKHIKKYHPELTDGINSMLKNQFILNGMKNQHTFMIHHFSSSLNNNFQNYQKLKMLTFWHFSVTQSLLITSHQQEISQSIHPQLNF